MFWLSSILLTCGLLHVHVGPALGQCRYGRIRARGVTAGDIKTILYTHNFQRSQIAAGKIKAKDGTLPTASNMVQVVWNYKLANAAQVHSNYCMFKHFKPKNTKWGKAPYGQNLAETWSSNARPKNWPSSIKDWVREARFFSIKNRQTFVPTSATGHFTQVAWAKTVEIGCGYTAFYDNRPRMRKTPYSALYTCDYYPPGNVRRQSMYLAGKPCCSCQKCSKAFPQLCAPN